MTIISSLVILTVRPSSIQDLTASISVLRGDVQHTRDLKQKVEQTVQDTIIATRIVEGFRNPQQNGQYLKTHATFPLEFFNRVTEQMRERLRWYKATIEVRSTFPFAYTEVRRRN